MLTKVHKNWKTIILFSWNYLHYNKCNLFHWCTYSRWRVFLCLPSHHHSKQAGKARGVLKADNNFSVWYLKTLQKSKCTHKRIHRDDRWRKETMLLSIYWLVGFPLPFTKVSQFQSMVCITDTLSYPLTKTVFCFFVKHQIKCWDMPKVYYTLKLPKTLKSRQIIKEWTGNIFVLKESDNTFQMLIAFLNFTYRRSCLGKLKDKLRDQACVSICLQGK